MRNNDSRPEIDKSIEIPLWRKIVYYGGMLLIVVGIVLFLSVFYNAFMNFSSRDFNQPFGGMSNAFIGMILMMVGAALMAIGKAGIAGSGILLDPKKARQDRKPYSHSLGGMVDDVMDGMQQNPLKNKEVIKVRCQVCDALNDEDAKFCKACGTEL